MQSFSEWLLIRDNDLDDLIFLENESQENKLVKAGKFVLKYAIKLEEFSGFTKFFSMLPHVALVKIRFVISVGKFIRHPLDRDTRENLLHWLSEASKASVLSGAATIPIGMAIGYAVSGPVGVATGVLIAKGVSWAYFYLGNWANMAKDHPEHGEFARKILALMPQSMAEKPSESISWLKRLWKRKKEIPQEPEPSEEVPF